MEIEVVDGRSLLFETKGAQQTALNKI